MPIKWILHWQPNPGATVNTQILSEVSQCAESFNGVKEGRWKSSLSIYKAMVRDQMAGNEFPRDFVGISLAEQPNSYFLVIRGQRLVVEAESSIQTIMEKLQSYKTRVALCFEGNQYRLGDFLLRVGKVVPMHSESLRGIVMEMEYLPISSWEKSHEIMAELLDLWQEALSKRSLPGHFVHIGPNFAEYGLTDQYSLQHTAVQYATIGSSHLVSSGNTLQESFVIASFRRISAMNSRSTPDTYRERNSRAALFDGIEEGGIRASSSYSHEIAEQENENALAGLQDRVILLKRFSGDIHEEVESHNRMLDRMGNDMDASRGVLSGTIDRFKMVFETKSNRRMLVLVASFVVIFLVIYFLTR
ncbi:hypothetical protein M569_10471 [Genlisea aurea]|uniref:Mediator of RNA polymerase II transcription subunit 20 n=1 Tax=Genlisea aurea TaxID=192259 RepID=S8DWJ2_9LAMI|nr:hypothetical protein M569_10471 [Genlisea aurea]